MFTKRREHDNRFGSKFDEAGRHYDELYESPPTDARDELGLSIYPRRAASPELDLSYLVSESGEIETGSSLNDSDGPIKLNAFLQIASQLTVDGIHG